MPFLGLLRIAVPRFLQVIEIAVLWPVETRMGSKISRDRATVPEVMHLMRNLSIWLEDCSLRGAMTSPYQSKEHSRVTMGFPAKLILPCQPLSVCTLVLGSYAGSLSIRCPAASFCPLVSCKDLASSAGALGIRFGSPQIGAEVLRNGGIPGIDAVDPETGV